MRAFTFRLLSATGFALTLGLTYASAQTTITFNGGAAADWTSSFNMASAAFGYSSTAGTGGTGAFTSSGNAGATYKTGLSTAGFETFQNSVFLKGVTVASNASSNAALLGFGDTATSQINTTATGTNLFGVRLQSTTNANELTWQFRLFNGASGADSTTPITTTTNGAGATFSGTAFTATNTANWFKLSTAFTKSITPHLWTFTASYQDFGADGLTAGAVLSSIAGSFTQATTYGASSLFASVGARNSYGNVQYSALDNLTLNAVSAIPEPSTYAALAGLGVLGLAAIRRRQV